MIHPNKPSEVVRISSERSLAIRRVFAGEKNKSRDGRLSTISSAISSDYYCNYYRRLKSLKRALLSHSRPASAFSERAVPLARHEEKRAVGAIEEPDRGTAGFIKNVELTKRAIEILCTSQENCLRIANGCRLEGHRLRAAHFRAERGKNR
jgi:hypothetical protein